MNLVKLQDEKLITQNSAVFINKQDSGFLCTNNEVSEREIKETISFTIASKGIKYLGINPCKEAKDLYSENYKVLMKEIKDETDGKIYYVFRLEE